MALLLPLKEITGWGKVLWLCRVPAQVGEGPSSLLVLQLHFTPCSKRTVPRFRTQSPVPEHPPWLDREAKPGDKYPTECLTAPFTGPWGCQWLLSGEAPPTSFHANRPLGRLPTSPDMPQSHVEVAMAQGQTPGSWYLFIRHLLCATCWGSQDDGLLSSRSCCGNLDGSSSMLTNRAVTPVGAPPAARSYQGCPLSPSRQRSSPLYN